MTNKFPVDVPKKRVIKALETLGFKIVREREHIAMIRENTDGTRTPLTMPNHANIKARHCERFAINREFRETIFCGLMNRVEDKC